jgi:hypothetical protein
MDTKHSKKISLLYRGPIDDGDSQFREALAYAHQRILFAGEANERFGRNLGQRNGAASGKRMLRGDRHADALVKQLFISQVAHSN